MRFELTIGSATLEPSRIDGKTGLSRLFAFDVDAFTRGSPPSIEALLGETFTLTLGDRFDRSIAFHGIVMSVERTVFEADGGSFRLSLGPAVGALAVGQSSRVFQEMTAVDVVKAVLVSAGIATDVYTFTLGGTYSSRPYIAQYRESDWAFIERLLAEEGITYGFTHTADATVLNFTDDTTSLPDIDGPPDVPFHEGSGLHADRDAVTVVRRISRVASEGVRIRDYDFTKPRLSLDSATGVAAREVYDFPGRFNAPSDGDQKAKRWLESLRTRTAVVTGEASTTRLASGRIFELTLHPLPSLNGRYLIDEVHYRGSELRESASQGLNLGWSAIPATTMHRPERAHFTRSTGGPQTGVVVGAKGEEIHPDDAGRIRVQFYWDRDGKRDDKASTWMRVGQYPLGGSMILPRIGWDVLVGHDHDDVDRPYVATHLYDGAFPVPYALPANKTRSSWQTATTPGGGSTNEMRFEDKKGAEEMFVNASSDMNAVVGDGKSEKVGASLTTSIGANRNVTVGSNMKVGVLASQSVSIGGSESLSVSAGRVTSIKASESSTIGGSRSATITGGTTLDAKGGRTLVVGGTMLGATASGVSRSVLGSLSVTVGGAWVQASGKGVSVTTAGATAETVGGAKIAAAGEGIGTSVIGAIAETVGGAYVIAAGGNAGETATGALSYAVGGAFLADAPEIEVEATAEISIRCGGATITITPGSVEVKAPTIGSPGAVVKKTGGTIKHN